jgi:hypothetical protein
MSFSQNVLQTRLVRIKVNVVFGLMEDGPIGKPERRRNTALRGSTNIGALISQGSIKEERNG